MTKTINTVAVNAITKSMIDAGILDQMTEMPFIEPAKYEFGLDDKVDAKLFPGLLRTAYTAVLGAVLRENGQQGPLFDEDEDNVESSYDPKSDGFAEPAKPLSYEEAQHFASAVFRMAVSQGRHEDTRWLLSMTKRTVTKDEATGDYKVDITTDTPIKPFTEWLTDELARTPEETTWFASLVYAKQLGVHVPLWTDGINEAKQVFNDWLNEVPWSRDGQVQTRKERAVERSANRKWEALKQAARAKDERKVIKLLDDWTLLCHSPKLHDDLDAIVQSAMYKAHHMRLIQEAQLAELEKLEFDALIAEQMAEIKATTEQIKARRAEITARLDAVKPEPKTKKAPKPIGTVKSLMPNVISSRRAA